MPNRFPPIAASSSLEDTIRSTNSALAQLDSENVTKVFKGPNGNSIVQGRLPYTGGYGTLYYDPDGIPTIVIGILPDGTTGMVVAKEGIDVLTVFS